MNYTESIKKGFAVINRNWQLVVIQMGALFASFTGFLIVVGVPLAVAFIIFGLDLTELSRLEDVIRTLKQPGEILSRYFALVVLVLASLLLYLLIVITLGIFLFGGSMGVIARFIKEETDRFSMKTFMSEGKRLFFPLVGFTSLIGLLFILVAFVLGLFGGSIAAIYNLAKEQEAALALFLGIFFSMILFVIGLWLIMLTLAVTLYGSAAMAIRGFGAIQSLKESVRYLYRHVEGLYLYCLIFVGYIIVSMATVLPGHLVKAVPFIGPPAAFGYQLAVYVLQSYLGLVMIAAVFCYYHSSMAVVPSYPQDGPATASETAIPGSNISGTPGQEQEESPPEKEEHE